MGSGTTVVQGAEGMATQRPSCVIMPEKKETFSSHAWLIRLHVVSCRSWDIIVQMARRASAARVVLPPASATAHAQRASKGPTL